MSTSSPSGGGEPPVERHEFLLRRFPSDPGEYDFTKKFPRPSMFHPTKNDEKGLSLFREGDGLPGFPTAEQVRAAASSDRVREFGGVVALLAGALFDLGLTITITTGDMPGHVEIEDLNRVGYDSGDAASKQHIKDIKDKIVRLAATSPPGLIFRIHPTPRPKT